MGDKTGKEAEKPPTAKDKLLAQKELAIADEKLKEIDKHFDGLLTELKSKGVVPPATVKGDITPANVNKYITDAKDKLEDIKTEAEAAKMSGDTATFKSKSAEIKALNKQIDNYGDIFEDNRRYVEKKANAAKTLST